MSFTSWTWEEGEWRPCPTLPLADRGFRYGMSFFETIRVHRGVPILFSEHHERLAGACGAHGFDLSDIAVARASDLFRHSMLEGIARIYVTAGDGPISAPVDHPRLFILAEERAADESPVTHNYRLTTSNEVYRPLFGGLKTANYWANVHALNDARQRGFDEALLGDSSRQLVSACCANVFLRIGDSLKTPPTSCGARAGVIRQWVIERTAVDQCSITMEEAQNADEIFLTSSGIGVRGAGTFNGRELPSPRMSSFLQEEYQAVVATAVQG